MTLFSKKKKRVLLLHLSMSANHGSTAAVMAFFSAARYTKHTTSPSILFQAGCFQASKTLSKPNIETHRLHKPSKQTTHLFRLANNNETSRGNDSRGFFFRPHVAVANRIETKWVDIQDTNDKPLK